MPLLRVAVNQSWMEFIVIFLIFNLVVYQKPMSLAYKDGIIIIVIYIIYSLGMNDYK